MSVELEALIDGKRTKSAGRALEKWHGDMVKNTRTSVRRGLFKVMVGYLAATYETLNQKHRGLKTGPTKLARRTGEGMTSIAESIRVVAIGNDIVGHIGGSPIMRIHEYGTHGKGGSLPDIRPTRSKYMTVPLDAALNSRGLPIKKSAKDWNWTFVLTAKNGNKYIAQRLGKKKVVLLYALKKRVSIPARLGMRETLIKLAPFWREQALKAMRLGVQGKAYKK